MVFRELVLVGVLPLLIALVRITINSSFLLYTPSGQKYKDRFDINMKKKRRSTNMYA